MANDNLEAWAETQGYSSTVDYTKPALEDGQLSENFHANEFTCNHCGKLPNGKPPKQLVDFLENIREYFGAPVAINSGYRCPTHNANVGGATSSQHLTADAADIVVKDTDPADVYAYADKLIGGHGGVGKYDTFTHIDCRGHKARW